MEARAPSRLRPKCAGDMERPKKKANLLTSFQRAEIGGRYLLRSNNENQTSLCEEYNISFRQFTDIRAYANGSDASAQICREAAHIFYEQNRIPQLSRGQEDNVSETIRHENFGQASIEASEAQDVAEQPGSSFSPSTNAALADVIHPACQLCGNFLDCGLSLSLACSVPECQNAYHRACIEKCLAPSRSADAVLGPFTCLLCAY